MPENVDVPIQEPALGVPENPSNDPSAAQKLMQDDLMRFAFQEQMAPLSPTPVVETLPTSESNPAPAEVIVNPVVPIEEPEVVDDHVYVKDNFGYESAEKLKADLAELAKLRQQPAAAAEPTWANEESKKIAAALNAGKYAEVKKYLDGHEMLSGYDGMSQDQQLKLFIQLQNPRYDSELIQDEYNEHYTVNQDDFIDDPVGLRKATIRLEQKKENDIEKAKQFFSQYQNKIQLPSIEPQTAPVVDEDYEQYKASTAKNAEVYNSEIVPKISSLKEADLQTAIKVNDENNKINFDIGLAIDNADLERAKSKALNLSAFIEEVAYENGVFKPEKLVKLIAREQSFDKYAQSIARQAVMAERKRVIAEQTPAPSVQRESIPVQDEKPEWKREYDRAMSV